MKSILNGFRHAWNYRSLFVRFVAIKISAKYKDSALGFAWSLVNPLSFLLVFIFLKSKVFHFNIPNYAIFVLIGLWIWNFIQSSCIDSCMSIFEYSDVVKKIPFPKILHPLSTVASHLIHFILTLPCLYIYMLVIHAPFLKGMILVPFAMILMFCFTAGLACFISIIAVIFRDIRYILEVVFRIVFFLTPVFYSVSQVPDPYRRIISLNPIYFFIDCFRKLIYANELLSVSTMAWGILLCFGSLILGAVIFIRQEQKINYYL